MSNQVRTGSDVLMLVLLKWKQQAPDQPFGDYFPETKWIVANKLYKIDSSLTFIEEAQKLATVEDIFNKALDLVTCWWPYPGNARDQVEDLREEFKHADGITDAQKSCPYCHKGKPIVDNNVSWVMISSEGKCMWYNSDKFVGSSESEKITLNTVLFAEESWDNHGK